MRVIKGFRGILCCHPIFTPDTLWFSLILMPAAAISLTTFKWTRISSSCFFPLVILYPFYLLDLCKNIHIPHNFRAFEMGEMQVEMVRHLQLCECDCDCDCSSENAYSRLEFNGENYESLSVIYGGTNCSYHDAAMHSCQKKRYFYGLNQINLYDANQMTEIE